MAAERRSPERHVGRAAFALCLALCGVVSGCGLGAAGAVPDDELRGRLRAPGDARLARVERVVDGDTVLLSNLGSSRLIGVDTPEVRGRGECYGSEAANFARRMLGSGSRVRYVDGVERRDRYGRRLVYLWLRDGRSVNAMLVEGGYARPLTISPNDRYARRFAALSLRARGKRIGIWSSTACSGR